MRARYPAFTSDSLWASIAVRDLCGAASEIISE
jgi:hypothetical protein